MSAQCVYTIFSILFAFWLSHPRRMSPERWYRETLCGPIFIWFPGLYVYCTVYRQSIHFLFKANNGCSELAGNICSKKKGRQWSGQGLEFFQQSWAFGVCGSLAIRSRLLLGQNDYKITYFWVRPIKIVKIVLEKRFRDSWKSIVYRIKDFKKRKCPVLRSCKVSF